MRKVIFTIMCVAVLIFAITAARSEASDISIFANKVDMGLKAKNVSDKTLHLFILIKYMGCNGSKVMQPGAKFELIPGKDYVHKEDGSTDFYDSYFWKLSHYKHYFLRPGQTVAIQNAPCAIIQGNTSVDYYHIGRAWHFNQAQWDWMRSNCLRVNPNCAWAK